MRPALAALSVLLCGCTLSLPFNECQKDADCPVVGGKKQFCTGDRLCVVGTPAERMCSQVYPKNPPAGAVPVGAILSLPVDNLSLQALQLGVDEINMLAGSGQQPLVLHLCDSSGTDDDALKAFEVLTRERGVVAVVGPTSSGEVISVAAMAARTRVPLVSPSATAPAISGLQPGYVFRLAPSDTQQGQVLAGLVKKGTGDTALLVVDDPYGNGLRDAFLPALGKSPVITRSFPEENATQVQQAAQAAIDLSPAPSDVVAIVYLDTARLTKALEPLPTATKIWMTDGAKGQALLDLLKANPPPSAAHIDRIRGTAPTVATSSQAFMSFQAAFQSKFGVNPLKDAFSAYSYDALYVVAVAIGNGKGAPTGALVSAGLRRISGTEVALPVGQSSYLEAARRMADGKNVPLLGTSGAIRFTERGDRDAALFEQWSIDRAKMDFTSIPASM